MLRISKKADYAILLLCYLARAAKGSSGLMSANELSARTGLSHSLVSNLLKGYAKADILESVRGQNGGYRLARAAKDLRLREILGVIEGPINFVVCADDSLPETLSSEALCGYAGICPSKGPLQVLHNRIVEMLDELNLAGLAQFNTLHGDAALTGHGT